MRILFVLIIFFVIGCKKDEQSPTPIPDLTSQYLGEWNFSESYYRAGMNGIYFDSLNHISIIENTDKINEIKIITHYADTLIFQVDESGTLSGLVGNYSKQQQEYTNWHSIQTYFVNPDSIYLSWSISPNGFGPGITNFEIAGTKKP